MVWIRNLANSTHLHILKFKKKHMVVLIRKNMHWSCVFSKMWNVLSNKIINNNLHSDGKISKEFVKYGNTARVQTNFY